MYSVANDQAGAEFRSALNGVIPWVLTGALFFNFALAIANTHVSSISATHVILAEVLIIGVGAAVAFSSTNVERNPWLFLFIFQISIILFMLAWRQSMEVKPVRDAIIVPTFVMLGILAVRFDILKYVFYVSAIAIAIALFEVLFLEQFTAMVNVLDFFIAKGAVSESARRFAENDLFVSGNRPNGRFLFDQLGIHRASSFFLEPVSFAAFGSVIGIILVAHKNALSVLAYRVGLAMAFFMIWLADGRLSFGILVVCILARPFFVRLPIRFHVITAPAICCLLLLVHFLGVLPTTGEGLGARLAHTVATLQRFDIGQLLGGGAPGVFTLDSGLTHLISTQGLLGLALFWLAPIVLARPTTESGRLMVAFVSTYFALNLMFTQSMLTIKTAALLWAAYGYAIAGHHVRNRDQAPACPPARTPA